MSPPKSRAIRMGGSHPFNENGKTGENFPHFPRENFPRGFNTTRGVTITRTHVFVARA